MRVKVEITDAVQINGKGGGVVFCRPGIVQLSLARARMVEQMGCGRIVKAVELERKPAPPAPPAPPAQPEQPMKPEHDYDNMAPDGADTQE